MSSEPTFLEQHQAMTEIVPGFLLILTISFSFMTGRAIFMIATGSDIPEAFGIGSPVAAFWVVSIISGVMIGSHSYDIEKRARQLARKRLRDAYGQNH